MLKDNRKMNASIKGLLALLLIIQTNKGAKPFILNFHNPKKRIINWLALWLKPF